MLDYLLNFKSKKFFPIILLSLTILLIFIIVTIFKNINNDKSLAKYLLENQYREVQKNIYSLETSINEEQNENDTGIKELYTFNLKEKKFEFSSILKNSNETVETIILNYNFGLKYINGKFEDNNFIYEFRYSQKNDYFTCYSLNENFSETICQDMNTKAKYISEYINAIFSESSFNEN